MNTAYIPWTETVESDPYLARILVRIPSPKRWTYLDIQPFLFAPAVRLWGRPCNDEARPNIILAQGTSWMKVGPYVDSLMHLLPNGGHLLLVRNGLSSLGPLADTSSFMPHTCFWVPNQRSLFWFTFGIRRPSEVRVQLMTG